MKQMNVMLIEQLLKTFRSELEEPVLVEYGDGVFIEFNPAAVKTRPRVTSSEAELELPVDLGKPPMIPITPIPEPWAVPVCQTLDDVMTREQFINAAACHALIDYDGFGAPSDGNFYHLGQDVMPSKAANYDWPMWVTHIVWFNR